jgi:PAS domain-containing protein
MVSRDQAPSVTPRRADGDDLADERARADVRRVLDAAQDGMGIVREGRWTMVNPALARQLGAASPEALTGLEVLPGVHAADRDVADLRLRSARASAYVPLSARGAGVNGIGCKLANVFSSRFEVVVTDAERMRVGVAVAPPLPPATPASSARSRAASSGTATGDARAPPLRTRRPRPAASAR